MDHSESLKKTESTILRPPESTMNEPSLIRYQPLIKQRNLHIQRPLQSHRAGTWFSCPLWTAHAHAAQQCNRNARSSAEFKARVLVVDDGWWVVSWPLTSYQRIFLDVCYRHLWLIIIHRLLDRTLDLAHHTCSIMNQKIINQALCGSSLYHRCYWHTGSLTNHSWFCWGPMTHWRNSSSVGISHLRREVYQPSVVAALFVSCFSY